MTRISLNARMAHDAVSSNEIEAILFVIEHPELDAPIRLSTDNAVRISDDPPLYATLSTWRGANPVADPYLWIIASAILPDDTEDAPAAATLVLENLDPGMVTVMRSFTTPVTVHMAVVLASSPDVVEAEWSGLTITNAAITSGEITLSLSRDEIELEPFPSGRMTRHRFPGVHP